MQESLLCTVHNLFSSMFSFSVSTIAWHTSGTVCLIACLEIWKRFCRLVYELPMAKNRNVTASLSWIGIDARNLVSIFTIFGPTKLISSSKSAGAIRVKFLYCPLTSWNFKSVLKLVPLYTGLFLYDSVCHKRLSRRFLLLHNMWCTNMKAVLGTCNDVFPHGQRTLVDYSVQPVRLNARLHALT